MLLGCITASITVLHSKAHIVHCKAHMLHSKSTMKTGQPTCRTRLVLSLPVSKCLQAKGIARGVGCSAHMLLPRGIAILPWPWGACALLAAMSSSLYAVCCLPAGCGCDRGAVGAWPRWAVHCRRPGNNHNYFVAVCVVTQTSQASHRWFCHAEVCWAETHLRLCTVLLIAKHRLVGCLTASCFCML